MYHDDQEDYHVQVRTREVHQHDDFRLTNFTMISSARVDIQPYFNDRERLIEYSRKRTGLDRIKAYNDTTSTVVRIDKGGERTII